MTVSRQEKHVLNFRLWPSPESLSENPRNG